MNIFIQRDQQHWLGKQDWVLLGFAVITPMSASVGMTFNRREMALRYIASFRSTSYQIYFAHAGWDWKSPGKSFSGRIATPLDYLEHADSVLYELISIGDELCHFLILPTINRSRHRVTSSGRMEASRTAQAANNLYSDILVQRISKLAILTEELKTAGLPATEASRIRAWDRLLVENIENLRMIKMYRSPQGLRCFARLFSAFLPPLYAPTFAQLARDLNSLSVAIVFTVITSLALTGLFESITVLEDPFVAKLTLDGIDVREELNVLHYHELTKSRKIFFPESSSYDYDCFSSKNLNLFGESISSMNEESVSKHKISRQSTYHIELNKLNDPEDGV